MPSKSTKPTNKFRLLALIVVIAALVGAIVWVVIAWRGNYAEEVAKPLEEALIEAGGVKKCSKGDPGRGPDNDAPNYHALYELPANREEANDILRRTTSDNGYALSDISASLNSEGNRKYVDRTSKYSQYSDLEDGNVVLHATVYTSSTHTGDTDTDPFCTVTKRDNPPANRTTIDFTINLPPYKR